MLPGLCILSLYPTLGTPLSTFSVEPFSAALCFISTTTYRAVALGSGVPKPLVCRDLCLTPADAQSLDDPEKKTTVDLESHCIHS